MRSHVLALIVVLAAGRSAQAQKVRTTDSPPVPAAVSAVGGTIKAVHHTSPPLMCDRLSIIDGLPNSNVRAVVQDPHGFIWFGTQDGLARYDGARMRVYRSTIDPQSVSPGIITGLALDATGKIWIGTAESGVSLYDPVTDRFTRYEAGPGKLSSEGVTAIARDRKGNMWFAMSGGGLNRFESATGTFTAFQNPPLDVAITAIDSDEGGNLWLGTTGGVVRWNPNGGPGMNFLTDGLDEAPIASIRVSSSGNVWVATDGEGLFDLDPKTGKAVQHLAAEGDPKAIIDDHVTVLFEDQQKTLWIGTRRGLSRLDVSGQMVNYQHDETDPTSLSFPHIESIFQDRGGVMWLGGFTVGVCKFDEYRQNFGYRHTATHAQSFFEAPDGTLWVGTYNGLYKYERASQRVTVYQVLGGTGGAAPISLEWHWILALNQDRAGTLWMAVRGLGLVAFDTKTETARLYAPDPENPKGLPVDAIFDLADDGNGGLWLATWGAGLVKFNPKLEEFTLVANASRGITSNHIYKLYPDPIEKQILWLGLAKGGLVRFNAKDNTAIAFRNKPDDPSSLSSDDVQSMYRDPNGIMWVGTYGAGLNRLDPSTGRAQRFTTANGLAHDVVFGIVPDGKGKLWLSTNGAGLIEFDPTTGKGIAFDSSDGLQGNEFGQGTFMRSNSGELFFGGEAGFNAFFPKQIKRDSYVPPVALTSFKVFNQEVALDRPIWTLPSLNVSYSDSFELQFAALSFAAPKKARYAYKLEGFDSEFIETDRPYAPYTHVDGGNYVLRVRASNQHGVWNEAGIAIKLAVKPPWYRTWSAYGVYILILAGIAYMLIRAQRLRVQRAEREGRLAVVERDLALTGAVQEGFLPEHNELAMANVQLCGRYRPADVAGGDWWWYERMSGGRVIVLVGDVTGHGPGPAMVTAAVATAFRVLIENGLDAVHDGLELLNREVLRVGKGKYHMTMAALELEEASGRWTLYSAGAPPALSLNQNGKHRVLFCPGTPLGTESGFETGRLEGTFAQSDRVLMYTDGIPEIALPNGNAIGMRRFAQEYERTRQRDVRDAATHILQYALQCQGVQPQADDWTFAIIEWGQGRLQVAGHEV